MYIISTEWTRTMHFAKANMIKQKHDEQKFCWREPEFMSNYSVILLTSTKSH